MPVNLTRPTAAELHAVAGVDIGTAMAGIRKANRRDLVLFKLAEGASVAGVFTLNRFCAAPVQVCREHLAAGGGIRALVINTGNANAGTGEDGLARARQTCTAMAQHLGVAPEQVLPFSTGVIMETLPVERIVAGLPAALADAAPDHWLAAAEGIMTTDTLPKAASRQVTIGGKTVTVTGISKGAGMIRPNMATMLGFVATDAVIAPALMQTLVREAADQSFNRITIDGDTSTNDSLVLMATHRAGHAPITQLESPEGALLREARVRGVAATGAGHRARRRGCHQVHHGARGRWSQQGRVPARGVRDRALAAGQDGVLRQRPQPRAHPGGRRLRGYRRPRPGA